MFWWLWNYLKGYVIIKVSGFSVERFINLSALKGYIIWDIKSFGRDRMMKASYKDIENIFETAKKCGCSVEVMESYGLPFKAKKAGKKCLVVERRSHIGGNIYCKQKDGINIHKYGAHIFHTSNKNVWDYINQFAEFNNYINSPVANYKGEIYNLPFNMNTFSKMWGIRTPQEAEQIIKEQRQVITNEPQNLEEQAISLVGTDIYTKLIKGYTEKQWGRKCTELPAFIIKRLPVRYTYDNNYFNDRYQGIPIGGYNRIIEKLLDGIDVELNCDFNICFDKDQKIAEKVIYTGAIDEYFNYELGNLEYRSLKFET